MIWAKYKNSGIYTFVLDVRILFKVIVLPITIPTYACPTPFMVFLGFWSVFALLLLCRVWSPPGSESLCDWVGGLVFPQRTMDTVDCDHIHSLFFCFVIPILTWVFETAFIALSDKERGVTDWFFSLLLGDKIASERVISLLLLLHWELKLFPPLAVEVWLWNSRKSVLVTCWINSYLSNRTGGRYPRWHQISTENQDHHVFGSWEAFAASSLLSESSISRVSRGTNSEKKTEESCRLYIWMSWKISLSNLFHAQMSSILLLFSREWYTSARENIMCSPVTEVLQKKELCYWELDNLPQRLDNIRLWLSVTSI